MSELYEWENSNYGHYYGNGSSNGSTWRDTTAKISIPAGIYLVIAYGRFDNTNKLEGVRIHGSNGGFYNQNIVNMTYGQQIIIPTMAVLTFTSSVDLYCSVFTGTTSNVDAASIVAFKIG